jgi:hypothetical protein
MTSHKFDPLPTCPCYFRVKVSSLNDVTAKGEGANDFFMAMCRYFLIIKKRDNEGGGKFFSKLRDVIFDHPRLKHNFCLIPAQVLSSYKTQNLKFW